MPTPFSYVSNTYQPKRIVQLPRFWKHSTCIFSDLAVRQWADSMRVCRFLSRRFYDFGAVEGAGCCPARLYGGLEAGD